MASRPTKKPIGTELVKIPPQNIAVEIAVLGAILIESHCLDLVGGELNETLFYDPKHPPIIAAILQLYKKSSPIDILTTITQLKATGQLENSGGAAYISKLTSRVASSANIETHVKILQESSLKRNIIKSSAESLQRAYNEEEDAFEVYSRSIKELEDAMRSVVHYPVKRLGDIARASNKEQFRILQTGENSGIPSHLKYVDNVTNGWQKSDLIVLAGRPGMGKTSFALSIALEPARQNNIPVAFFSLEMSAEQLAGRLQANISRINASELIKKQLNDAQLSVLIDNEKNLDEIPFFIDDTPSISISELKSKARMMYRERGVRMIVIDYLQLMTSGMKFQNRENEIAEISKSLKSLAKELDIPIIALSQLSRAVEQRGGDKKPQLSDLRESGQIEQDADLVLFCFRPDYYGIKEYQLEDTVYPCRDLFLLLIAKHRNGSLGEIPLSFLAEFATITNREFFDSDVDNINKNGTFVQEVQNEFETPFVDDENFNLFDDDDKPF